MDPMAIENCSIVSAKESLPKFGVNDQQADFLPSLILPEIYRTKSGKVVYPAYTQEEKALHWALDRLTGWELPGKAHVEEYFRSMYRQNFRPRTYGGALNAIYDFLSGMLIFKGGTSLSKAYRLIERFSEDVDVSMDRAGLGFGDEASDPEAVISGKERRRRIDRLKEACQQKIVDELRPMLIKTVETALGDAQGWSLTVDEDDPDRQTLLYAYPSSLPETTGAYIRPAVKIELGARSDHWPSDQVRIAPYVAEQFPAAFETTDFVVKVLAAERTFWEKATLLHAEYYRPSYKEILLRLSRHYYDTSRLILSGIDEKVTDRPGLLQRVVEHKKVFFPSGWAHYDEAIRGSLRLTPHPGRIRQLEEDCDKMREMFFAEQPVFADVLRILEERETHFNQGA